MIQISSSRELGEALAADLARVANPRTGSAPRNALDVQGMIRAGIPARDFWRLVAAWPL
jgi:hypothetical protein